MGTQSHWTDQLVARHPYALVEMRQPSTPPGNPYASALACWGFECQQGWQPLLEKLLDRLEAEIARQPAASRGEFRVVQIKEKFGTLRVYLELAGTPEMEAAIDEAERASAEICEICAAPGRLVERGGWCSTRCVAHTSV